MKSILYCTSHYRLDFCKVRVKQIRELIKNNDKRYSDYKRVAIVDKIIERDFNGDMAQFNRIRLYYK